MPTSEEVLRLAMQHRQGPLALEVEFALTAPWTVLFGASGSGKTTVLRTIMGFVRPDQGTITLGDKRLLDTSVGVFVPPHLRQVRTAGQTARLFPGMSVRRNIEYGVASPERDAPVVEEVLRLFRIDPLAEKLPQALSGGERQRVSVARAAASAVTGGAALLLLDEPFGGLDYALRDALSLELREWLQQRKVPVLSVTHDVGEAFLLDAEVIRLEGGRIVEQGSAGRVLAVERERLLGQLRS